MADISKITLPNDTTYDIKDATARENIPTKTSDLQNDSGFMTTYTETDPTVPSWAKAESKPTYTYSEVGAAAASHDHAISDVTDLQTTLDGKAASSHSHAISDVTNLQTTLNGKQSALTFDSTPTNNSSNPVTSGGVYEAMMSMLVHLGDDLDGKAALSHTHAISDVTNLQTTLNAKANSSDLATVATSGSYNDLSDKPTIPTIPVSSVNGQTGAVVLDAEDVGALPDSTNIPSATSTSPKMNGTAAVGSETTWAKGDHVHPTDTGRQAKITASGILKGDGNGGVTAATAGTDYIASHQDISGKLDKSGGTMTGALTLAGAPTSNLHAATKKYVDDNAGGTTITYGNTDLIAGTSPLATGTFYAYYE